MRFPNRYSMLWPALAALCWCGTVAWSVLRPAEDVPPLCLFKRLTGYPCATCGSTRGVSALVAGDVLGALAWNPMVISAILIGPVVCVWWWMSKRRSVRLSGAQWTVLGLALLGAVCINWAYVIVRGH